MAVILICDWIVTQPFCLACMEPISVNMEGPPAVGHASPASSVGEADPHLVSVFHIACMPFLLPPAPEHILMAVSRLCSHVRAMGCRLEVWTQFLHQTSSLLLLFLPSVSWEALHWFKKTNKTVQGDASFKKLLRTERLNPDEANIL